MFFVSKGSSPVSGQEWIINIFLIFAQKHMLQVFTEALLMRTYKVF